MDEEDDDLYTPDASAPNPGASTGSYASTNGPPAQEVKNEEMEDADEEDEDSDSVRTMLCFHAVTSSFWLILSRISTLSWRKKMV